jgi:hypothetical protein
MKTNSPEYIKWFNIGLELPETEFMVVFVTLVDGTDAYWGFVDGYAFAHD